MPIQITMPRMSDTMEEGTLVKWNVKVGDKVKSGDEVADIETDKATMPLQVYDDGTVALLAAQTGQTLKVGSLILVLAVGSESVEDAAKSAGNAATAPSSTANKPGSSGGSAPASSPTAVVSPDDTAEETIAVGASSGGGRIRVSPLARKIADEKGVNLATLKGTGPDGRIIKRDVLNANTASPAVAAPHAGPESAKARVASSPATPSATAHPSPLAGTLQAKTIPLTNMRKTIARRLAESKSTIPHFTVTTSVDMDLLLGPRGAKKQLESQGIKLSVNDFVMRAAALSLVQHPLVNASWGGDTIQQHGTVNIGVAVALPAEKGGGLVVPTIRDAHTKGLRTLNAEVRTLAEKARTTGLTVEEMSGGTFTISNLGMFGVDHFEAIINPPQAAILAVGAAIQKPVVRDNQIVVGWEMTCTLSADHRVVDGAMAAEYLQTLKKMLENPAVLLV